MQKELKAVEKNFHAHLRAIGHTKSQELGGGTEWFLTNEDSLKSTANLLGLKLIHDHNNPDEDQGARSS